MHRKMHERIAYLTYVGFTDQYNSDKNRKSGTKNCRNDSANLWHVYC